MDDQHSRASPSSSMASCQPKLPYSLSLRPLLPFLSQAPCQTPWHCARPPLPLSHPTSGLESHFASPTAITVLSLTLACVIHYSLIFAIPSPPPFPVPLPFPSFSLTNFCTLSTFAFVQVTYLSFLCTYCTFLSNKSNTNQPHWCASFHFPNFCLPFVANMCNHQHVLLCTGRFI